MSDTRPGPRIGMVHDCHFYQHFFDTGSTPPLGLRRDEYSNSGVFLIRPGETQFLTPPILFFVRQGRISLPSEYEAVRLYEA